MTKQKPETAIEAFKRQVDAIVIPNVESDMDVHDASVMIKQLENTKEQIAQLRKDLTKPITEKFRPTEKRIESLVGDLKSKRDTFIAERIKTPHKASHKLTEGNGGDVLSVIPVSEPQNTIKYSDGTKIVVVDDFDIEVETEDDFAVVARHLCNYCIWEGLKLNMPVIKGLIKRGSEIPCVKKVPKRQVRFYGAKE